MKTFAIPIRCDVCKQSQTAHVRLTKRDIRRIDADGIHPTLQQSLCVCHQRPFILKMFVRNIERLYYQKLLEPPLPIGDLIRIGIRTQSLTKSTAHEILLLIQTFIADHHLSLEALGIPHYNWLFKKIESISDLPPDGTIDNVHLHAELMMIDLNLST